MGNQFYSLAVAYTEVFLQGKSRDLFSEAVRPDLLILHAYARQRFAILLLRISLFRFFFFSFYFITIIPMESIHILSCYEINILILSNTTLLTVICTYTFGCFKIIRKTAESIR
jgi:hypothetical protein